MQSDTKPNNALQRPEKKKLEPRQYQLDLLDYVEKRNAIIYLPTGAGKTFVAIMALKRFSEQFQKTIEEGGKRAIFMCNTIELARQQAVAVRENTNLEVGFYVGERDVDHWSQNKWEEEIKKNQVLVGTAQIFVDIVTQNLIKITNLNLVIVDECHHGTKNHPMHAFMHLFQLVKDQSQLPRVVGLTGVLLKGNKQTKIREELENLEATFRGNIVTVRSMEAYQNVMLYSTQPTEELVPYSSATHFRLVEKVTAEINACCLMVDHWNLGDIQQKHSKNLGSLREPSKKNYVKNLLKDFVYQMNDFGLYAAAIAIMSPIIELEVKKRQAETIAARKMYRYVIGRCELLRHMLLKELKDEDTDDDAACHTQNIIWNFATPKLQALLLYLIKKFKDKKANDIRCLLFVERRYTAKCVYYVLQKFIDVTPELSNILRPEFMIGRNSIQMSIKSVLDRQWNKSAMEKFRTGECNILICSNVLEEGVDIQACNYVLVLDNLKTFNSYVQTKGRARSSDSIYAVFVPAIKKIEFITQIQKYLEVHKMIQNFLIGRIVDSEDPKEEAIAEQFVDVIPPFVIPSGACLLASSALSLLHRYCQLLPADVFGGVSPVFQKQEPRASGEMQVLLQMPLQSTVKESILSDWFPTAKLAKISAAFEACKMLYEQGELNDKLLPITKQECLGKVAEELFDHWKKFNDTVCSKKAGKQHCRLYARKYPDELCDSIPRVGELCYAYEIIVTPDFQLDDYTAHMDALLKTKRNYAVLLRKPLPALAEMPLFMNQGKLTVKIAQTPLKMTIASEAQLQQLRQFHTMLFRDLLECWKSFFVLDQRNEQNAYLLVPLAKGAIDWDLVKNFQRLEPQRCYSVSERQEKVHRPEDYLGNVVNKWYSGRDDERFVVTKVLTDLTPLSAFDNENYESYVHFMDSRYKEQVNRVVQQQQFMLEVRPLTKRRNFFVNAVGKASKVHKNQCAIRLIPEMCHNFKYPGDMWAKALLLPSILHRMHFMLHAEELRRRVNRFLGIATKTYTPKPLTIDKSLRRVVDIDGNATEELEEPKKMLPPLPTKASKPDFETMQLEDVPWKQYMEPADFSRNPSALFPVEIDYYYKFISGLATDVDALKLADEEKWSQSQLLMPATKNAISLPECGAKLSALSITDVPLAEKLRIDILERSLNKTAELQTGEQADFLAAITTAKANDVFDMERFEFLGDSFLKFSVSLYLANKYPKWHEGFLTEIKSKLVSNRNLVYCLLDTDVPERVCASMFKPPHEWLPPLLSLPRNVLQLLQQDLSMLSRMSPSDLYGMELCETEIASGECTPEQLQLFLSRIQSTSASTNAEEANVENDFNIFVYKESLRDKVVADTLEAILGVCVKNYGIYHTFRMLEFFGVCKPAANQSFDNLLDLQLGSTQMRANISTREVDSFLLNYQQLEQNLGYKFRDRAYLLQALTHPSYPTNRLTGCYQELEFVGDAILDFLVSCYIFERYKHMTPGMLTDMRSALVNNITLGCVCVRHRFHLFLLAENSALSEAIRNFDKFQEKNDHHVTAQVHILMEENLFKGQNDGEPVRFNLSANVDVPKALGDILEAIIAAVYLDCRDIRTTWAVIYHLLEQEINQFAQHVPIDAVRQLNDHKYAKPIYSKAIVDEDIVMVKCQFTCLDKSVEVDGFGVNAKQAKKAAAKHALQILRKYAC